MHLRMFGLGSTVAVALPLLTGVAFAAPRTGIKGCTIAKSTTCEGVKVAGKNLKGADLRGANLRDAHPER